MPSDQFLDRSAATRSVSLPICTQVSYLRSRRQIRVRSSRSNSIHEHYLPPNLRTKPLAKRGGGTLGRQLSSRFARSRHCAERASSQTTHGPVRLLLS